MVEFYTVVQDPRVSLAQIWEEEGGAGGGGGIMEIMREMDIISGFQIKDTLGQGVLILLIERFPLFWRLK